MKILNLKNLKNLRQSGLVLKGNFGVIALRNPSGSIAYRFQKRIKKSKFHLYIKTGHRAIKHY